MDYLWNNKLYYAWAAKVPRNRSGSNEQLFNSCERSSALASTINPALNKTQGLFASARYSQGVIKLHNNKLVCTRIS